jgi:hypothetical protein
MSLLDHMCPKCDYYMPLANVQVTETDEEGNEVTERKVMRICRACGHQEDEKQGLVMETAIQQNASESHRVFVNEYTKNDPRLPHTETLKCPNDACASRTGQAKSDVIYIKYDTANMKFLYICNVCDTQWKSRS